MESALWMVLAIIIVAFGCEYVDSTLGMGYGTTLMPLLLLFGFTPLQIVPAILLSELVSGALAGCCHHYHGNVDFKLRHHHFTPLGVEQGWSTRLLQLRRAVPRHLKIALLLGGCSIVGTTLAIFIAVNIPDFWLKLYIGSLVFTMGLVILVFRHRNFRFSWHRLIMLGSLAAFNKGMSGGGYGPVVTSGQILAGVNGRNAVGITSVAESLTCLTGLMAYFLMARQAMDWRLAGLIVTGAVLSVPFSALSVRKISPEKLTTAIAVITLLLGSVTIMTTL